MTRDAQLGVLAQHPLGVESGAVRIEAASLHHRVAGEAVALDVTGDAALQPLPRRLAVSQEELPVAVVIAPRAEQGTPGREPRLHVAALAELPGVVAIGAGARAGIGVRRMAGEIPRGMIAPAARGVGNMARETGGPRVAAGAAPHRGRGDRAVALTPLGRVARGRAAGGLRALRAARPRRVQR